MSGVEFLWMMDSWKRIAVILVILLSSHGWFLVDYYGKLLTRTCGSWKHVIEDRYPKTLHSKKAFLHTQVHKLTRIKVHQKKDQKQRRARSIHVHLNPTIENKKKKRVNLPAHHSKSDWKWNIHDVHGLHNLSIVRNRERCFFLLFLTFILNLIGGMI